MGLDVTAGQTDSPSGGPAKHRPDPVLQGELFCVPCLAQRRWVLRGERLGQLEEEPRGEGSQVSSPGVQGRGATAYGRCDRRAGEKGQILLAKLLSGLLCGVLGWGFLLPDLSPRTEEGQTCKFKTPDMLG